FSSVNVPFGIRSYAFRGARPGRFLDRIRNEIPERSIFGTADANTALPAVVTAGDGLGLRIRDVDHVILVDINTARPAELFPLFDEVPVLIEDLDTVVVTIADEQSSSRIHCQRMRLVEFTSRRSELAPSLDQLTVFRELQHASGGSGSAGVSFGNEDVAVRCDKDVVRLKEKVGFTRSSRLSERHEQFSLAAELEDLMSLPRGRHAAGTGAIGHPHVILGIDENAVRRDHQACTETLDQPSGLIEMQDRIEHG